ncbi:hypothetical protein T484DRAFT_1798189, partial [Baffinella frigidus]
MAPSSFEKQSSDMSDLACSAGGAAPAETLITLVLDTETRASEDEEGWGWEAVETAEGRVYYVNSATGVSTWDTPEGFGEPQDQKKKQKKKTQRKKKKQKKKRKTKKTKTTSCPARLRHPPRLPASPDTEDEQSAVLTTAKIADTEWSEATMRNGASYFFKADGETTWDIPPEVLHVRASKEMPKCEPVPGPRAAFPRLLAARRGKGVPVAGSAVDMGQEVFEEMTGAALALGKEVFQGTILSGVAGQVLSSVLSVGEKAPFLGPIVAVLKEFKGMVESYQDAEEECGRLVVWCVGSLGCIVKLYSEGGGDADPSEDSLGLLDAAVVAIKGLKNMVETRKEPSKGAFAKVCKFFKSGPFLEQCEKAKKHVTSAVECLMIDVSVDTKNGVRELQKGVRELLARTDLLADMTQSLEDVRSSVAAIAQGVARLETGQRKINKGQREIKEGQHTLQEGVDLMRTSVEEGHAAIHRALQEQCSGTEEGLFTEVLFQVDPALMGHAQQREKMFSLAAKFEDTYPSHTDIMLHGRVRLSHVGSGEIQTGLCRNSSSCMIWSSQGCGWVSGSCPIKNVFDELKQQLLAKTLGLQVVVVCHTYGARETAQQLRDAGVPVVVSINRALMQLDGAVATKLLFNVIHPVIDEIVRANAGNAALVQNTLRNLLGKHVPGVSRLESAVLGVPVRVKNSKQSGTVINKLKLETWSNLTSSGEKASRKKQKKLATELQLAVCDVPYPSVLVGRMLQALGDGNGSGGLWHIKGKGDTPFFRGRAVAYEASMSGLVNDTFAVVWRIETLADTVSLGEALEKHGAEGSWILVWIDVTRSSAEWEDIGTWLMEEVLDQDNNYKVVLLLTSGECNELQDAALQLSTQLKFDEFWISDVKDASSSLVKAHALHEDLRLSFREETEQCSPLDLLDEKTLAELVAQALPGLVSGDGSEGAQQDVPIAGMYLDGRDLIVTICVRDISFLKNLSHAVLTGTLDMNLGKTVSLSLQSGAGAGVMISGGNMGQPVEIAGPRTITVESDMTNFAQNFEHAILAMDKLTAHQDEKKDAVLRADDVHLFAPAGAGKTFVALHCILLALSQHPTNKILFVVRNEALALFVIKWLCARFEGAVATRSMLERLHLLYQPCEDGPRAVELEAGRLSTKNAKVEKYDMIVVDEAHH